MKIAIIGLGYVGISLAACFSKKYEVIGFDVNEQKIEEYQQGIDRTQEVGTRVNQLGIKFTHFLEDVSGADIFLMTVPTPTSEGMIETTYVKQASKMIAPYLKQGAIVVYESTVYPFFTREECLPILEQYSGKQCGVDFSIGYSPERVNPGDKSHTVENITKVVAGFDEQTTEKLVAFYGQVIQKVHPVTTLEVAEACKVLENSQRDLNIALINQFAMLFEDINTHEVVEAMNTKWNALGFTSGLVGGHCIAEDPYYLIHKTQSRGLKFSLLEEARYVNDSVSHHIVMKTMELLNRRQKSLSGSVILLKGVTFKENCPDVRNSKAVEIAKKLKQYGASVVVIDPVADLVDLEHQYQIQALTAYEGAYDAIIYAVAHDAFKCDLIHEDDVIVDIKGMWRGQSLRDYYAL